MATPIFLCLLAALILFCLDGANRRGPNFNPNGFAWAALVVALLLSRWPL